MPNGLVIPNAGLRRYLSSLTALPLTDADLLARFVATRDDSAFTELVRRHGPSVLAVCRRVTRNRDDADDAFQATFLVLARKARRIRPGAPLGAWLYGVAVNTSRVVSNRTARRRAWETPVAEWRDVPAGPGSAPDADAMRAVLEEVAGLSTGLRAAVVLCELEGRSRSAAARALGIAEGTLSSRLAAARKALAVRLGRRGFAPAAVGLSLVFARAAVARPSAHLVVRTVAVAVAAPPAPSAAASLSTLFEGVLRMALAQKLKVATAVLGLIAVVAVAELVIAADPPREPKSAAGAGEPPKPAPKLVPAPNPLPKAPNKLVFDRSGKLTVSDPDGKNERAIEGPVKDLVLVGEVRFSPDGRQIASFAFDESFPRKPGALPLKLYVRSVADEASWVDMDVHGDFLTWSPDGTEIVVGAIDEAKSVVVNTVVDVKTKKQTVLKLPDNHLVTDWSRDGKHLLTVSLQTGDKPATRLYLMNTRLHLMNRDGTEHKAVTDGKTVYARGRLSPDGRSVLCAEIVAGDKIEGRHRLVVIDVATGKGTAVEDFPMNGGLVSHCWSPDGKRIGYVWRHMYEGKPEDLANKETESFLVVCDANGKNGRVIVSEKAPDPWALVIGALDWR